MSSSVTHKFALVPDFFSQHSNVGSNIVYLKNKFGLKLRRKFRTSHGRFILCVVVDPGYIVLSTMVRACPITLVSGDGDFSPALLKRVNEQFLTYYNPKKVWNDTDTEAAWIQG